ncbi:hypothetical protein TWF481_003244 [Arthrobotrys musiformis]|uniref:Tetrapyrrole biosynthesis uroporphyrinogen III synthase domain-containing protein n=1 Tax=Arthrobotrys musiformis TaxID=47236 RepID=A0AAV9VPY7_9PEZI
MPPILLLKTKSTPTDPYDTLLSQSHTPIFIPVLQHSPVNADIVRSYILNDEISPFSTPHDAGADGVKADAKSRKFAGMVITSQRAVESLSSIMDDIKAKNTQIITSLLKNTLIYVVGPATKSSLELLGFSPSNILGWESGTGAVLSDFIISHYPSNSLRGDLLFLTGETHSTILPTRVPEKLKDLELEVNIEEVVVYKTSVVESFEHDLSAVLDGLDKEGDEEGWIVFFSPTGTDAALRVLSGRDATKRSYKTCTIGPTTRDFMFQKFKKRADAMAKTPSPEGVLDAISSPTRVSGDLVV